MRTALGWTMHSEPGPGAARVRPPTATASASQPAVKVNAGCGEAALHKSETALPAALLPLPPGEGPGEGFAPAAPPSPSPLAEGRGTGSTRVNVSAPVHRAPETPPPCWRWRCLLAASLATRALPVSALPSVDFRAGHHPPRRAGPDVHHPRRTSASSARSPASAAVSKARQRRHQPDHADLQPAKQKMDSAAQDVQAAINASAGALHRSPYPPVLEGANPADAPIPLTTRSPPPHHSTINKVRSRHPAGRSCQPDPRASATGRLRPRSIDPARVAACTGGRAHRRRGGQGERRRGRRRRPARRLSLGANDHSSRRTPQIAQLSLQDGTPQCMCNVRTVVAAASRERPRSPAV